MKVQCSKCESNYNIKDEKIPDSGAKIKCPECQNIINVMKQAFDNQNAAYDKSMDSAIFEGKKNKLNSGKISNKRKCPFCNEEILVDAKKCKHCGSSITENINKNSLFDNIKNRADKFSNKAKEKADLLNEKAKETVNNINVKRIGETIGKAKQFGINNSKKIDRLLFFSFKIGKVLSAILVAVFFIVFIGCIFVYLKNSHTSFKTPSFDDLVNSYTATLMPDSPSNGNTKKIERNYGKKIREIISKYNFNNQTYDVFVSWLSAIPAERQKDFIYGIESFLEGVTDWSKKYNKKDVKYSDFANRYKPLFMDSLEKYETQKRISDEKNIMILVYLGSSLFLFIIFLIIPILIKIEENTRLNGNRSFSS